MSVVVVLVQGRHSQSKSLAFHFLCCLSSHKISLCRLQRHLLHEFLWVWMEKTKSVYYSWIMLHAFSRLTNIIGGWVVTRIAWHLVVGSSPFLLAICVIWNQWQHSQTIFHRQQSICTSSLPTTTQVTAFRCADSGTKVGQIAEPKQHIWRRWRLLWLSGEL